MSSPYELLLHIAADVEVSDVEDNLHIKSEPVNDYYDFIATSVVGQIMLCFTEPFWKSANMGNAKPFKFSVTFDCENGWVRSREILVMQLCKALYQKFGGYYLISRNDPPIEFWLSDEGFFLNEADRNYYDRFPREFANSIFVDGPFND